MARKYISRSLYLSLTPLLTITGLALSTPAYAHLPKQTSVPVRTLPDFDDDDGLDEHEEYGIHTLYVDNAGNLLGTFVNVPGAKVKVYADGRVELQLRNYTREVDYYPNGNIRSIGDIRFRYYSNSRIRKIGGIHFRYNSRGVLRRIGRTNIDYGSRGRLEAIEYVDFDYDNNGMLESIEASHTRYGTRIVVVN